MNRAGRPAQRADLNEDFTQLSFRVRPGLKNLLLDMSEGADLPMVDYLEILVLRESGHSSVEDYVKKQLQP